MDNRQLQPVSAALPRAQSSAILVPLRYLEENETRGTAYDGDHDVSEYLRFVRRYKWMISGVSLLTLLAGLTFDLWQVPLYRVKTSLEVQADRSFFKMSGDGDSGQVSAGLEPKVRLIQSRRIRRAVAQKLLAQKERYVSENGRKFWLKDVVSRMKLHPSLSVPVERMISMTSASVSARAVGEILEITCESPDPQLAADFANLTASEFIEETLNIRGDSTLRANQLLGEQVDELKRNLEKSERDLQEYAQNSGLMFTSETDTVAEDRLRGMQRDLLAAQADRAGKQAKYEVVSGSHPETVHTVLNDSVIEGYDSKVTELKRQLAELTTTLTPAHYKVRDLQAQIVVVQTALDRKKAELVARYQSEYQEAVRRERMLSSAYASQIGVVSDQARKGVSYGILKREVDANRQLYQAMLQRVKELGIAAALRASNIRIIEPAIAASAPFRPNPVRSGTLGLATGLLASLLFVFVRQRLDQGVKAPGDGPAYLNVPELGVIPAARASFVIGRNRRSPIIPGFGLLDAASGADSESSLELATWHRGVSLFAESFRSTVTSFLLARPGKGVRTVVVTSPGPSEGKSTVISNLAIALVETTKKVLIIDADVRKPRLHKVFDIANSTGLTNLIQQQTPITAATVESLSVRTEIPNLYLLPSGPPVRSVSGLLFSMKVNELLRCCHGLFDFILIDSPPILQFADARILGRSAEGVILVLRSGTGRADAMAAAARLAEDGVNVLGTILNDWDPATYNTSHYSRYYKYYADVNRADRYAERAD